MGKYLNSIATSTFSKIDTTLGVGSSKTVNVDKPMSIYGKLTDSSGKDLAYQKITIKVDGKTYTVNTTKY